jgi:regulator of protease activity HflC (stomatin/prohibitin superfamily)
MEILTQIFNILKEFATTINPIPFGVLQQNELGLILRLGKYQRTLKPGFYWKIPLLDKALTCSSAWRIDYFSCSSMTKDHVCISHLEVVCQTANKDAFKRLISFNPDNSNIEDIIRPMIRELVAKCTLAELSDSEVIKGMTDRIFSESKDKIEERGMVIENVEIAGFGLEQPEIWFKNLREFGIQDLAELFINKGNKK